ncbi:MAG: peptidoglycan DD-metalloendopeptidase family protein [Fibrobacteria bacterium]
MCSPGSLLALAAFLIAGALLTGCREDKVSSKTGSKADFQPQATQITYDTLSSRIKMEESFNTIARKLGLPESEATLLLQGIKDSFRFKLYAGQSYKVVFTMTAAGRSFHEFILEDRYSDRKHVLSRPASFSRSAQTAELAAASLAKANPALPSEPLAILLARDKLSYSVIDIPVHTDTVSVTGSLSSNLYEAFVSRGETGALIQQVTKVFAWDIDFFKDPRTGDEFNLLVEKKYGEDGSFRGYGQVLSAKYVNRGRDFYGILYKGSYFTQEGRSMEKMLMKAPLNFAHVSSGFSAARLHPVLGVTRPHWGIDYSGPKNTKILAAGDGTVEYSKWVNGYGKTIKIRHNGVYNTYYAHLNGYASAVGAGRRVKQGEVIGFMGRTGLATGVHLDYRVEFNGQYINPASLKMESKQGVEKTEWKEFCDHRDLLLARMTTSEFKHFASASRPSDPAVKAF